MKGIVVYGSNYGTTRTYAQELARRTGWPAVDWQQAQKLAEYETVVYLGGLYAGGVVGLKAVLPQLEQAPAQKLVVVTVGVADRPSRKMWRTFARRCKSSCQEPSIRRRSLPTCAAASTTAA